MNTPIRSLLSISILALLGACASSPEAVVAATDTVRDAAPEPISAARARARLRSISKRPVQLWVVVHIRAHKHLLEDGQVDAARLIAGALADARAVVDGGGDMIVLINSRCAMPLYQRVIAAVRAQHPDFPLGISALAYGPENLTEGFRLARQFDARMVWMEVVPGTRFEYEDADDVYLEAAVTPRALSRRVHEAEKPDAMLVAGVHMKYTRNLDGRDFAASMRDALGWVDGINITGPQTGVLADVERVRQARQLAGDYPLGLASGVSVDNIDAVLPHIDYAIVGTSLKVADDPLRTDVERVRALRAKMDARTE